MSRFYIPRNAVRAGSLYITGSEAHHIIDVMRLRKGDLVVAFDGTGKEYSGTIEEVKPRSVSVKITSQTEAPPLAHTEVTLMQAIPKKEKMDYIVEKATELGVRSILPIMSERTIVDWEPRKRLSQAQRWRRIALEASKQCGRPDIPEISEIVDFDVAVRQSAAYEMALIAALSEDAVPLKTLISGLKIGKIAMAIGPEGDFSPSEVGRSRAAGFKVVGLGRLVLKSDTAGLAALAMVNYEFSP